jgi:Argonaute linker 1 domain
VNMFCSFFTCCCGAARRGLTGDEPTQKHQPERQRYLLRRIRGQPNRGHVPSDRDSPGSHVVSKRRDLPLVLPTADHVCVRCVRVQENGYVQQPVCVHTRKQKVVEWRFRYLERLLSVSEIRVLYTMMSLTKLTSCSRSVRPTLHGLVINVDVSHAIVYVSCLTRTLPGAHLIHYSDQL